MQKLQLKWQFLLAYKKQGKIEVLFIHKIITLQSSRLQASNRNDIHLT